MIKFLKKFGFTRKLIYYYSRRRSFDLLSHFEDDIKPGDKILDIGSGTCTLVQILKNRGFEVTALDVSDLSFTDGVKAVIYDGNRIPYKNDEFDIALILTVLHHTPDPEKIIKEAKRVSKKIIIIEEIYKNIFHKYITFFMDSLLNLEFRGHPHTNKTEEEWRKLFEKLKLRLSHVSRHNSMVVFSGMTFVLEK